VLQADENRDADDYRRRALDAVRRTLTMLPADERPTFWRDKILRDAALVPIRGDAGFDQLYERHVRPFRPAAADGSPLSRYLPCLPGPAVDNDSHGEALPPPDGNPRFDRRCSVWTSGASRRVTTLRSIWPPTCRVWPASRTR